MKLSHALATSLVTVLHAPFVCGIKLKAKFLSDEEIASFLKSSVVPAETSNAKARLTNMIPISAGLHGRIRSQLSEGDACEAELEDATTTAALTTITRTTSPHKDHYRAESAKGRPVQAQTGLVFLETNHDVRFVHGDEQVTAEAGKLVVFEGSEEHHTEMPEGQLAKLLGPFALLGRGLSLVGGGASGPCKLVSSDKTLTSDFSCDCTDKTAAIEIEGPATLDLNGYEVSCTAGSPDQAVVLMSGDGATLLNGVVNGEDSEGNDCIDMEGDHQKVHGVTVKYCRDDCIDVEDDSDYATITENWIKECEYDGINVGNVTHTHIANNRVEETEDDGIDLDGSLSSFATVVNNYVAAVESDCIDVKGTDHKIVGNEVAGCGTDGIDVRDSSERAEVRQNVVSLIGDNGIEVDSDHNVVSENKISTVRGDGIRLQEDADYNTISNNYIEGVGNFSSIDSNGIKIEEGADHNTVSNNKISMIGDDGIDVDGDYNEILNNSIEKTIDEFIDVDGENNVIQGNQMRNTVGEDANGIEVEGDHNLVKKNKLVGVTEDCIDVRASDTDVINNYMQYCGDDGIEVSGDGNVMKKNFAEACDIALDDESEDEACGTNTWKNNQGNTFMPACAGHSSSGHGGHPGHGGHGHPGQS